MNYFTLMVLILFLVSPFLIAILVVFLSSTQRGPPRFKKSEDAISRPRDGQKNFYLRSEGQWRYQMVDLLKIDNYYHEFDRLDRYFCEIEVLTIGRSVMGRDIKAVLVNNGALESILVVAGVYPIDLLSVTSAITVLNQAMDCAEHKNLASYNWYIVPLLNPDGYNISFHSMVPVKNLFGNAKGVDLNKNFDFKYNFNKDGAGDAAFDQPESRAFKNFFLGRPNITIKMAIVVLNQYIRGDPRIEISPITYPWWYSRTGELKTESTMKSACYTMLQTSPNLVRKYTCYRAAERGETPGTICDWLQNSKQIQYVYNIHQSFTSRDIIDEPRRGVTELGHDLSEIIIHLLRVIDNPSVHREF